MSEITFFFSICLKVIPNLWSLVGNQMFSSTQRELFQTEICFRKLGRTLVDKIFNEIMEYSGGLFVVKFIHKIETSV